MSHVFRIGLMAAVGLASMQAPIPLTDLRSAAYAQDAPSGTTAVQVDADDAPLDEDELAVLVARIALYPDELVALISSASLYPLQVVEAARFIETSKADKALQPKATWDGSIISLLNYPEIVRMMSDDLDWTQALGDALVNQQKDVLIAIQQLRSEAVANGLIKTDEKITVTQSNDNIVIAPVKAEEVFVPQYAPEMLYEPGYAVQPITYYPSAYPNYEYPTAPYFAAAVTGLAFAAAVDWDDGGVWGGHWGGGDIDIDCDHCLNNIDLNGRVKLGDIDWKNVDRGKIKFDRNQFANIDKNAVRDRIKANSGNNLKARAENMHRRGRLHRGDGHKVSVRDIRRSKISHVDRAKLPAKGHPRLGHANLGHGKVNHPVPTPRPQVRPHKPISQVARKHDFKRPVSRPRLGAHADIRPRRPSAIGHVGSGRKTHMQSHRGHKAMGGGHHRRGGGGHRAIKHRGGHHR